MEIFNFDYIGNSAHIPTMDEFIEETILAGAQNSVFGGTTAWNLGVFPQNLSGYLNPLDCNETVLSGTFNWSYPTNGLTRNGTIFIG